MSDVQPGHTAGSEPGSPVVAGAAGIGRGPRLGVDPGQVRVGLAISDADGVLATPLHILRRDGRGGADLRAIASIVHERGIICVIVGYPRHLSGRQGSSALAASAYAAELARHIAPVPVHLWDERLTTVAATRRLAERGVRGRRRQAVIDSAAAAVLLQGWLDAERLQRRQDP